ncbi:F-box domain - like 10 [Theobroma cacao]|nr:F-box domain - like 10 [Theobroma cacao]
MPGSDRSGLLTRFTKQLKLIQALQKVKAKFKPKKTRDRILDFERDKVDVISSLPDHILCRIISFLPFESVVQISVLSTRWKNLWKMALVKDGTNEEAVTAVLNFLGDFPQPRDKWGMQYNFDQGSVLVVAIAPTGKQESQRQFSLSLGRNQRIYYYHQPSLSTAFNLKALYLVSVSHVSSEMNDCNENPLYSPYPPANYYSPLDLEDAMLDFRQGPGYYGINVHGFKFILQSIRGVITLTLCRWVFKELILPERYLLGKGLCNLTDLCWINPKSYNTGKIKMSSIKVRRSMKLEHLKAVMVEGFENEEEEFDLAKQLKKVLEAEPLIIKWDGTVRRLIKVHEQLRKGRDPYEFIEKRAENHYELCPKHPHMDH